MSILSELFRPYQDDPVLAHQRNLEEARKYKLDEERRKFLSDPSYSEKILSHWAHGSLPEKVAAKTALGSPLERVEKGIPEDDPRKGLAEKVLIDSPSIIRNNPAMHPGDAISKEYINRLVKLNEGNALFDYIFEKEAGLSGKGVATLPGYDKYKEAKMTAHAAETPFMHNPLTGALFGAGIQGVLEGVGAATGWKGAAKLAGGLLSKLPHPAARIAGAGLLAVPALMATDAITYPIRQSQWAAANPGKTTLLEFAASIPAFYGVEKGIAKGASLFVDKTRMFEKAGLDVLSDPSIANMTGYLDARGNAFKAEKALFDKIEAGKSYWSGIPSSNVGEAIEGIAKPRGWSKEFNDEAIDLMTGGMNPEEAIAQASQIAEKSDILKTTAKAAEMDAAYKKKRGEDFIRLYKDRMDADPTADPLSVTNKINEELDIVENFGESISGVESFKFPNKPKVNPVTLRNEISKSVKEHDDLASKYMFDYENPTAVKALDDKALINRINEVNSARDRGLLSATEHEMSIRPLEAEIMDSRKHLAKRIPTAELWDWKGAKLETPEGIQKVTDHLEGALSDTNVDRAKSSWDNIISHYLTNRTTGKSDSILVDKVRSLVDSEKYKNMINKARNDDVATTETLLYGDPKNTRAMLNADIRAGMGPDQIYAKYGKLGWYAGVAAIASSPALALLSPDSAEAASIKFDPLAKAIGATTRSDMEKKIVDMGLHSPVISTDGQSVVKYQNSLNFTPELGHIARKEKLNGLLAAIMTPGGQAQFYFKAGLSPQPILASKTIAALNNTDAMLQVATKNLDGIADSSKEIAEYMRPLLKYQSTLAEYNALKSQDDAISRILSGKYADRFDTNYVNLSKRIKKGNLEDNDIEMINYFKDRKAVIETELAKYDDPLKAFQTEWKQRAEYLAQNYPSSRVFFAAEGQGMEAADPWVKRYLTHEETLAAARIKSMMEAQKERSIAAGMDVIDSKGYMHYAFHPESDISKLDKIAKDVAMEKGAGIDMSKYHSRSFDSLPLMPDVHYALRKYIPDSNMRIEMADFWREWAPFLKKAEMAGYNGVADYLRNLTKAFSPVDRYGGWNKWADRIQMFEVARLIALSPSVGFKHAMKVMANVALGGTDAIKTMPEAVAVVKDLQLMNLLKTAPADTRADLSKAFIGGKRLYTLANDLIPYERDLGWFEKGLRKWNDNTNFIVNNVELFDRGMSMLGSLAMAAKRGMTPEQASYLVHDTILKANFLNGIHNPQWLRDPKIRLLMLFQGTPFKIWEQRLINTVKGGGAIKEGIGKLYNQLKEDIKTGERNLKFNLIKDAFNAKKDVNGNSYAGEMMRMVLSLGAAAVVGKQAFDVSLMDQVLHPPFLKLKEQSIGLATNPLLSAGYGTLMSKDDETSNFVQFLNKWLPNYGVPSAVTKAWRLNKDDIPEIYKDNKLQYIFGIPSWKEKD